MDAWKPASCEEFCGKWPVTTKLLQTEKTAAQELEQLRKGCMESCGKFQESLSSCVGTVLFEPGQLAVMAPKKDAGEMPEHCVAVNATCLPDLPVKYQTCVSHKAS